MLRENLQNDLKTCMKNQEADKVSAIRLIIAKMKEKDVEIRGKGGKEAVDADICSLMQTMIKQRKESIKMYLDGNRPELAAKEQKEIDVIEGYLPKQMTEDEVNAAVKAAIAETGASSMKDMGAVMGKLREKYAGQMDFGSVSGKIKAMLG